MSTTLTRSMLSRPLVIAFMSLAFPLLVQGQTAQPGRIQVIPRPQQVVITNESFRLDRGSTVSLADPRSTEDQFAAADFVDDVKQTAGLTIRIGRGRGRSAMLIGLLNDPTIQRAIQDSQLKMPASLKEEGYVLSVTPRRVVVAGADAAGIFYGLQTLKQLVRGEGANVFIPGVMIIDWPSMRWRGVSDDISRGPIPTVDYIKRQLRTFAAFKLNLHSFYMEHVFASASNPLIGPSEASLKPEEIRELVNYAHSYHIELVPEQQTFGHLHKALKFEKYNELAETPYGDVLSPQQEGSYKLIAEWYRELNELFPGKFFHIGEDETFELGEGQSREAARVKGVGAVYFEHLNRVRELLKPYDRRLIFWGDIALNHPDLIGNISKDMIVANWDYAPRDDYSSRIQPFKNAGLDQFVCPGVGSWNQIFPNVDSSTRNIVNFVRDGQKANVLGMMNTSWDDDGESLFEMTWYGMVLGAAVSWQTDSVDLNQFDASFDWAFFRNDGDVFVQTIHKLGSVNSVLSGGASNEMFWRDPFTPAFQMQARTNADKIRQLRLQVETAEEDLLKSQKFAKRNASMIPVMIFAAQRLDHTGRRFQTVEKLSREYWDAYLNLGDRTKARRLRRFTGAIYNQLREMAEELGELKESYSRQWLAENRPYWLENILARYDQAIGNWLDRSRALDDAIRKYESNSILPSPEEFGLGPRQVVPTQNPR